MEFDIKSENLIVAHNYKNTSMANYFDNQIDLLFNDLYQFTCSYSYFLNGKHED